MYFRIVLSFLFLSSISNLTFSQNEDGIKKFIKDRKQYEKKYLRQTKHQMRKSLRKENWFCTYSNKKEKFPLREIDFIVVPMFTLTKEAEKYSSNDEFLKYINIWKRPLFHDVFMFRNEKYYGTLGYNDLGCCGIVKLVLSEKDYYPQSFLIQVKKFRNLKPEYVFYISGILFAWWYIKDDKIFVYYLNDDKIYNYQDFLNTHYPEKRIREEAVWNNLHPLVRMKK